MTNQICATCGKVYTRVDRLREHIAVVHEGVRYQCSNCLKYYRTKQSRDRHKCSKKTYTCRHCDQVFNSVSCFIKHATDAHGAGVKRSLSLPNSKVVSKYPRIDIQLEEDPQQPHPQMLPNGNDELTLLMHEIYKQHWSSIRTHHRIGQYVQDVYM